MHMVGRYVVARGQKGTIIRWEPFLTSMCDCLVRLADGSECWYASSELRPDPDEAWASIPLTSRQEACAENDRRTEVQLEAIAVQHRKELYKPWPGAEFGKAIIGNAIQGALVEVAERIPTPRRGRRGVR